jgi:hypothetical protein
MAQGSDQPTQTINRPKNPEFQNSYEKLKNDLIKGLEGDIVNPYHTFTKK